MGAARPFRSRTKCGEIQDSRAIRPAPGAPAGLPLEDDRDRPVVHELERHPGAEDAGLDRDAEAAEGRAEALVERLCELGPGGVREARPRPLAGVGEQRELGDDERGAARLEQGAVEASVAALEDA